MSGKPIDAEDIAVLLRLQAALPDVGLNGWFEGVQVLDRVIEYLTAAQQQGQAVAWADEWRAAVAAKLSSYGLSEEAAAVFASSELDEYKAGLCDCAENDPVDMVDLMMGVARDAIEKWKIESAGRPFGHKNTAPPPSAPVGVDAPGSRAWMAEVCRAAALSLAAHGVRNDQLSKVADWITQQPAAGAVDKARFKRAPCYLCGYNGPGYYQPDTHPCAAKYHATKHQEPTDDC